MRRGAFDGVLAQLVRRPECVEYQSGVGQQILAAFLLQAHRIGKYRHRKGFGQIRDAVEAFARQQFVDLCGGSGNETVADRLEDRRRQYFAEHGAGPGVGGRVSFKNNALRTPRLLLGEVVYARATAGTEGERVVENGMHLFVARDRKDFPFIEIDQRAGIAQQLMGGIGVVEEFDRERVDIQLRNGRRTAGHRIRAISG